ncbi:hypothetical protein [Ruminococcus sp.]|uniref:hypothetical protein n=1 Tax=Ruminococcus sp. TaxID=41978 RepID=UPI0025F16A97|nr:hypothetical protein [Ruminococcus sp.]
MKKSIMFALAALLMLISIVSCGEKRDPKYIGKWEATGLTVNGETTEQFLGIPLGALFRFEIEDNGKVTWKSAVNNDIINNANENTEIKWKEIEADVLQFTVKDLTGKNEPETMNLKYRDGKLVVEENGSSIDLAKVDEFSEIDSDALNAAASAIQNFGITQ